MKSFFLSIALSIACFGQAPKQLMTISPNGSYLYNSYTGKAVYIVGDDAFLLPVNLCTSDVTKFMADRAERGYNALWIGATDNIYSAHAPADCNGDNPFTGSDFGTLNSSYWSFIDSVVTAASAKGIVLFFNPAFVGTDATGGWFNDFTGAGAAGCCSSAVWAAFGTAMGTRYKNANNLVWLVGGDANISGNATIKTNIGALATAIAAADPNHLITAEACRSCNGNPGNQSAVSAYSGSVPSWLTLNWSYDQQANITTTNGCPLSYTQGMPSLEGETWYENEHSLTGADTRAEGYWATLTGCPLGTLFGNDSIWDMLSSPSWQSQLNSVGSIGEQYTGLLFRSRHHWLLVPDSSNTVLTGGISSGLTKSVCACASDGSSCIVYDQSGSTNPPQIAMAHFSGTIHAWWFDPSTAATTDLGTFTNSGTHTFTPTSTSDWVLVLDLNSLNLPAPGGWPAHSASGMFSELSFPNLHRRTQ